MPMWLVVMLIVGLVLASLIVLMRKDPILSDAASKLCKTIADVYRVVRYYSYLIRWEIRNLGHHAFAESASGVLLVATMYVVIELLVSLLRRLPVLVDLSVQLGLAPLPELPALPLPIELGVLALGILMACHHWHDWKLRKREMKVPSAVNTLLLQLAAARAEGTSAAREAFLSSFMETLVQVLETGSKRKVAISLMEFTLTSPNRLVMTYFHPDTVLLDKLLSLAPGEGGAGMAYQTKEVVYVPSIDHLLGVKVGTTYEPLGETYVSGKAAPFCSLLCAPVSTTSVVLGVLSFSSEKRNAFVPLDFEIARMAGVLLGLL